MAEPQGLKWTRDEITDVIEAIPSNFSIRRFIEERA